LSAIRGDDKTGDQNGMVGGTAAAPDSVASPSSSSNVAVCVTGDVSDGGVLVMKLEMEVDSEGQTNDGVGGNEGDDKGEGEGNGEKSAAAADSAVETGIEVGAPVDHAETAQSTSGQDEKENTAVENGKEQETVDLGAPVESSIQQVESLDNAESKV
jgi:hypothetical protein